MNATDDLPITAPMTAVVAALNVAAGEHVTRGQVLIVLEAMKMQHPVPAPRDGVITVLCVAPGDMVEEGQVIARLSPRTVAPTRPPAHAAETGTRRDLAEVEARIAATEDAARAHAVERRRARGQRTARENIADLCDPGSFFEYGQLALAAQRGRYAPEDLRKATPADGMVTGIGSVNADAFGPERSRTGVLAYDYTVLAGTQGYFNHRKTDRILKVCEDNRLPVVFFTEGGGGRPGDVDVKISPTGLSVPSFAAYARLSGLVPRIGIASGRCFAGNAAFFGCSDITIATKDATIGMGGPAMIEGGGLGRFKPEEVGPIDVQSANGVVDLVAEDEAHAVALTRAVLSCFQGDLPGHDAADQTPLRAAIPEDRQRAYDIRSVITTLADTNTFIELRGAYGTGMITGLLRIAGRPMGLIANALNAYGGAIDATGAEKAARFMQLCDAFDLPILSLCDTPGFMVGPESEAQGAVRRTSRMFVTGASVSVPWFTVVLRRGYGLGAMAMAAGGFDRPEFTVAWPTGEFGAMGLEGAVRLGFRKELEAEQDPEARDALFRSLVAAAHEQGKALSVAEYLEIDAVIDPARTRDWLIAGLDTCPRPAPRSTRKRPFIDTW